MADRDTTALLIYGAAGAAALYYLLKLNRRDKGRAKRESAKHSQRYMSLRQPIVDLKTVLFSKTVGAKDARLLYKERGPCGTVKFVYELPSGHRVFSYLPLDFWTAH